MQGGKPPCQGLGQSPRSQKQKQGGGSKSSEPCVNPPRYTRLAYIGQRSVSAKRTSPLGRLSEPGATETLSPEKTLRCFRGSKAGPWVRSSGLTWTRRFDSNLTPALHRIGRLCLPNPPARGLAPLHPVYSPPFALRYCEGDIPIARLKAMLKAKGSV